MATAQFDGINLTTPRFPIPELPTFLKRQEHGINPHPCEQFNAHGATQSGLTFKTTFPHEEKFQQSIDWASFQPCPAT
jgi:hypothetical protein